MPRRRCARTPPAPHRALPPSPRGPRPPAAAGALLRRRQPRGLKQRPRRASRLARRAVQVGHPQGGVDVRLHRGGVLRRLQGLRKLSRGLEAPRGRHEQHLPLAARGQLRTRHLHLGAAGGGVLQQRFEGFQRVRVTRARGATRGHFLQCLARHVHAARVTRERGQLQPQHRGLVGVLDARHPLLQRLQQPRGVAPLTQARHQCVERGEVLRRGLRGALGQRPGRFFIRQRAGGHRRGGQQQLRGATAPAASAPEAYTSSRSP